jgi:2'-5' RNA ligase
MIPEDVKENIEPIKNELAQLPMNCKFVEKENLHICLSFLGEVDESRINDISTKLDEISKDFHEFEIDVYGIKTIPNERYIRVLAFDVTSENNSLNILQERLVKNIGGNAKPPHLTICRVRNVKDKKKVLKSLEIYKSKYISKFNVSSIQLIESRLRKTGPIYSVLHESVFS